MFILPSGFNSTSFLYLGGADIDSGSSIAKFNNVPLTRGSGRTLIALASVNTLSGSQTVTAILIGASSAMSFAGNQGNSAGAGAILTADTAASATIEVQASSLIAQAMLAVWSVDAPFTYTAGGFRISTSTVTLSYSITANSAVVGLIDTAETSIILQGPGPVYIDASQSYIPANQKGGKAFSGILPPGEMQVEMGGATTRSLLFVNLAG